MLQDITEKVYKRIKHQTLDVRFMLFTWAIICMILLVLGGLYIWYERDQTIMASQQLVNQSLQMQLRATRTWYQDRLDEVETVSQLYAVRTQNYDNMQHDFKANLKNNKDINGYVFVNKLGVTMVDTLSFPGANVKDREYFRRGMQGESFITDIIVGKTTGRKIIIFSAPVASYDDSIIGVVFATSSVQQLSMIINQFEFGKTGISYLIDHNGTIIAQSGSVIQTGENMKKNEGYSSAIAGYSGVNTYINQEGRKVIGAYQWIPERNWTILCEVDEDQVLLPFYNQLKRASIGSGLILLLALYLTWLMSKNIQKSILLLVDAFQRTQAGDYSYVIREDEVEFAPVEIRKLCHVFNIMIGTTNEHVALLYDTNEALAVAEKKYRLLSTQDPLTQIYNRTYFELEINQLQSLQEVPICVVGFDVDGLKLVNDTLGHKAGDGLIRAAAECIKNSFRDGDTVARVGGDEFVVLMPGAGLEEMQLGIERVKRAVVEHNKIYLELPLAMSMGGAIGTTLPLKIEELISEADNVMYQQKSLNREHNRNMLLSTLIQAAEVCDHHYNGHIEGVKKWALKIGKTLQMDEKSLQELESTAQYHDIGKVGIAKEILNKKEKLSDEEWGQLKQHSELGGRIAKAVPELFTIADYITAHHERWDGTGYPNQLKEDFIPLISRIIAVADAYDSMQRNRIYRQGKTLKEARQELFEGAGTQFDPHIVKVFLELLSSKS